MASRQVSAMPWNTPQARRIAPSTLKLVAQTNLCATMVGLPSFKALRVAKPYCKIKSIRNRFAQSVFPPKEHAQNVHLRALTGFYVPLLPKPRLAPDVLRTLPASVRDPLRTPLHFFPASRGAAAVHCGRAARAHGLCGMAGQAPVTEARPVFPL